MKKIVPVISFFFLLLLGSSLVAAQEFIDVRGNISSPFNTTGVVIEVFNGSNSVPSLTFTVGAPDTTGFGPKSSAGTFSISPMCKNDSTTFIKVWGINGTAVGCIYEQLITTNLSASLVANGAACKYANACSSGICCSGVAAVNSSTSSGACSASACSAGTTAATGGSSGGGGGGGGGTPTPAPAEPSQETIDIIKGALPASFTAADAQVTFKTISAPAAQSVSVVPAAVAQTLAQLETIVKTDVAKAALAAIQQAVEGGSSLPVSITKTIEVVQATNKVTGEKVTVSVVRISIKAPADKGLKGVEVVEVIPKAAASSISQVTFTGDKPVVLEADPVVKWTFADILKGQTKDLSYVVNGSISSIGTSTVAVSKKAEAAVPPAPSAPAPVPGKNETGAVPAAKKPTPVSTIVLVVVVAAVVVAGWLFIRRKKSGSK